MRIHPRQDVVARRVAAFQREDLEAEPAAVVGNLVRNQRLRSPRRTSARIFENPALNSATGSARMGQLWRPTRQVVKLEHLRLPGRRGLGVPMRRFSGTVEGMD